MDARVSAQIGAPDEVAKASSSRRVVGFLFHGLLTLTAVAAPLVVLWSMKQVELDIASGSMSKEASAAQLEPTVSLVSPRTVRDDGPIRVSGSIRAEQEANLSFLASGHVERIEVDLGDRVEEGATLARLDRTLTSAVLAEAQALLKEAEWDWNKVERLAKNDLAADTEVERRRRQLEAARARVRQAEYKYDGGVLKAPFSGYIAERMIEVGQYVSVQTPAFLFVDLDRVKVVVGVTEHCLGRLTRADPAVFRVEAYPDRVFTGTVQRLGVYTPQASGTFQVEIEADNASGLLKAGMVASVDIQPARVPEILVLPVDAIRFRGDRPMVFFYDAVGGFVNQREIETGDLLGMGITIRSGLRSDDRVVMRPGASLFSGQVVSIGDNDATKSTRAMAGHQSESAGRDR